MNRTHARTLARSHALLPSLALHAPVSGKARQALTRRYATPSFPVKQALGSSFQFPAHQSNGTRAGLIRHLPNLLFRPAVPSRRIGWSGRPLTCLCEMVEIEPTTTATTTARARGSTGSSPILFSCGATRQPRQPVHPIDRVKGIARHAHMTASVSTRWSNRHGDPVN